MRVRRSSRSNEGKFILQLTHAKCGSWFFQTHVYTRLRTMNRYSDLNQGQFSTSKGNKIANTTRANSQDVIILIWCWYINFLLVSQVRLRNAWRSNEDKSLEFTRVLTAIQLEKKNREHFSNSLPRAFHLYRYCKFSYSVSDHYKCGCVQLKPRCVYIAIFSQCAMCLHHNISTPVNVSSMAPCIPQHPSTNARRRRNHLHARRPDNIEIEQHSSAATRKRITKSSYGLMCGTTPAPYICL